MAKPCAVPQMVQQMGFTLLEVLIAGLDFVHGHCVGFVGLSHRFAIGTLSGESRF